MCSSTRRDASLQDPALDAFNQLYWSQQVEYLSSTLKNQLAKQLFGPHSSIAHKGFTGFTVGYIGSRLGLVLCWLAPHPPPAVSHAALVCATAVTSLPAAPRCTPCAWLASHPPLLRSNSYIKRQHTPRGADNRQSPAKRAKLDRAVGTFTAQRGLVLRVRVTIQDECHQSL